MFFVCIQFTFPQSVEIKGKVESETNIENSHVINKTAKLFTVTSKAGEFVIVVKLNDTISFSSIQHKYKEVVILKANLSKILFEINMLEEEYRTEFFYFL